MPLATLFSSFRSFSARLRAPASLALLLAASAACSTNRTRDHAEAAAVGVVAGTAQGIAALEANGFEGAAVEDSLTRGGAAVARGMVETVEARAPGEALARAVEDAGAAAVRGVVRELEGLEPAVAVDAVVASAGAEAARTLETSLGPATEAYLGGPVAAGAADATRAVVEGGVAAVGDGLGALAADEEVLAFFRSAGREAALGLGEGGAKTLHDLESGTLARTLARESVQGVREGLEEAFPEVMEGLRNTNQLTESKFPIYLGLGLGGVALVLLILLLRSRAACLRAEAALQAVRTIRDRD